MCGVYQLSQLGFIQLFYSFNKPAYNARLSHVKVQRNVYKMYINKIAYVIYILCTYRRNNVSLNVAVLNKKVISALVQYPSIN